MILLSFLDGENKVNIGLFKSIEAARSFCKKIKAYKRVEEKYGDQIAIREYLEIKKLDDYQEVDYGGIKFPITSFSFKSQEDIEIIYEDLVNFDDGGPKKCNYGIAPGQSLVDAYYIDNNDLKDYIENREKAYERTKQIIEKKGYLVSRAGFSSEDGEYICYGKKERGSGEKKGVKNNMDHFLCHLSPDFIEIFIKEDKLGKFEDYIKGLMD